MNNLERANEAIQARFKLWNMALDIKFKPIPVEPNQFTGMTAGEIYKKLAE